MKQGRAIGKARTNRRNGDPHGKPWPQAALCAVVIAAGVLSPDAAVAATPAGVSAPAPMPARAPAPRLDASRLADRAAPGVLELQPIIVAQQGGFSVRDISGPPDAPLPFEISLPPENGDLFRVIMVRGLPENFELTAGVSLDDAWALSPSEASGVSLVAPPGYDGAFSMEVLFIRGNGESRERQVVNVRIGPESGGEVTATAEEAERQEASKPALSPEIETSMFDRAQRMMAGGDIAGARLILRYLAEHNVAGAVFAMGQSYDPGFLQDIYVRGGDPSDVAKAREWYRRAADMGNTDARSRLTALE